LQNELTLVHYVDPKSLTGQRLLHRSTFHTGHFPTTSLLLPSTLSPPSTNSPPTHNTNGDTTTNGTSTTTTPSNKSTLYQILLATQSGSLSLLTPLPEPPHRRLTSLSTYLTSTLSHACGLNPRAYRSADGADPAGVVLGIGGGGGGAGSGSGSGRGVVDGGLVMRWVDLGAQRRGEACARAGAEEWVVRSDLEAVGGGGLGML